jgi:hypothetical protein
VHLQTLAEGSALSNVERGQYGDTAALIPQLPVSERLFRYKAHLSREFDRTLAQLERLQRMRLGQPSNPIQLGCSTERILIETTPAASLGRPVAPPIKVQLAG